MSRTTRRFVALLAGLALVVVLAADLLARRIAERRLAQASSRLASYVPSLELADYGSEALRARDNAAHWAAVGAKTVALEPWASLSAFQERSYSSWSAEERPQIEALLRENQLALDLLHRAAGLTASSFEIHYIDGAQAVIPNLLQILQAGQLLLVELRVELAAGRLEQARLAHRTLRALALACASEPLLITQLISHKLERLHQQGSRAFLEAGLVDPQTLDEIAAPFVAASYEQRFRQSIGAHAAMIRRFRLRDLEDLAEYGGPGATPWERLRFPIFGPLAVAASFRYYSDTLAVYGSGSWRELAAPGPPALPERLETWYSKLVWHTELREGVRAFKTAECRQQQAAAAAELVRFAHAHGGYPEDLAGIPQASTNALTGEPFHYQRLDRRATLDVAGGEESLPPRQGATSPWPREAGRRVHTFRWRLPALP